MLLRHLTRNLFRFAKTSNFQTILFPKTHIQALSATSLRRFSSFQTDQNAYRELETFLSKEIQLEKSVQKHPNNLPAIDNFHISSNGPKVTLTSQSGKNQVSVNFSVVNSVNANDLDQDVNLNPFPKDPQSTTQLKARPSFTVEINQGGKSLSFVCSFLPGNYPEGIYQQPQNTQGQTEQENTEEIFEDFQIDEFTIHEGEWSEKIYSSDCSVIDGELYDKLIQLLDEHGIGEGFANQLAEFATAYEHRQYINLLEKLQHFVKF